MIPSVLLFALLGAASALHVDEEDKLHFESWRVKFNKFYSQSEYSERLHIFTQTKRRIDKHNERNLSFTMALNQFSDMTFSEFRKSFLMSAPQNCSATQGNYVGSNKRLPDSIDWRKKGDFVTPVKQQGNCGSCWTFSTTGCLESVTAIQTGKLVPLSEQQLVDCAQDFKNHGCEGGLPSQAFEYILYNKGLMTEEDYPYNAIGGACRYQPGKAAAVVADVMNITAYKESEMEEAVGTKNPVSFAFEVVDDFMSYSGGVYTSTECHKTEDKVNHAVLAVGYGEQNGKPYWIVKNSWGDSWGNEGYFLIERGKNMCGLAACASFPAV